MNTRNLVTTLAASKLILFTVLSLVVTSVLAMIIGSFGVGDRTDYKAVFTSASALKKGDDVRVAGISVGEVEDVEITHKTEALVTFDIDSDVPMTTSSGAQVRYLNLVGDRYLALSQGTPGASPLTPGATIPASQTKPAIDLTELFNGFQPLFQALQPKDVNKLSLNIVRVLQGEGGTIQSVLKQTADLTSALADRDQLIGQVISNLSSTLHTINGHHTQLTELLRQLNGWMGQLDRDKGALGDSISNIGDLTDKLAGLITDIRPSARADIAQLRRVMTILNKPGNRKVMADTLHRLPGTLRSQTRIGTYGSWYNYYLCDLNMSVKLPSLGKALDNSPAVKQLQKSLDHISVYSTAKRCDA